MIALVVLHEANPHGREDAEWYVRAHQQVAQLASEHTIPIFTAAGVVAALSVQQTWDTVTGATPNLDRARELLMTGAAATFGGAVTKARLIYAGADPLDVLSGNKERAFYQNLAWPGQTDQVTLDRWIARLMGVTRDQLRTPSTYERVADAFRSAAGQLGIPPDALQASVWSMCRRTA